MSAQTEVQTAAGTVRGRVERDVVRWRAIPYAAPPVGDLRLRAPQPVAKWTGVRDATQYANASVQGRKGAFLRPRVYQPTDEDCLTLNVVAPREPSAAPRPVLVFIHGGGYTFGTSALELYSGVGLVRRGDIVYVSVNYRLGALGYLDFTQFSTPERQFDSNLGLRDQVAALDWVQHNISAFGGDPDNVTIMGESAGGAAVTTLLATPAAKGLFQRAIAQSSPADWAISREEAAHWAREFVAILGVTDDPANALASVDAQDFRRAGNRVANLCLKERPGMLAMVPVVDGDFLPESPISAYANGNATAVPLICGSNHDEGTLWAKYLDVLPTNPERVDLLLKQTNPEPGVKERIVAAYPGYPAVDDAIRIGGDYLFLRPTLAVCDAHSAHAPTYNYRYDFAPRLLNRIGLGAAHATEMFAVFGFGNTAFGRSLTALGGRRGLRAATETMQGHWLSFAKYGAPLTSWPAYTTELRRTLVIDATSRVVSDVNADRRLAWQSAVGQYDADPATIAATTNSVA
ncbi:carboxylesterase/lipase family protein [Antrihabitans cavernicola]|uniref:Carboxylic ester hydrolase n=1 Tax=Antrihabitans cavernicola TaxID=2495913 RepID=A0A5A7SC79_9NOCA|nr:carboxylesterase/lipase family protein [Spelaeibacter cavernicola]KAA0023750.1 carboxylesterase/lipase family protein [Spelaeibacter cavernicola]